MYLVQVTESPKLNVLIYGPPGIGKTWLTSTAQDHPAMADIFYLNIEGGLATVAGRGDVRAINIVGIEKFKPTADMPGLPENCSTLEDEFWKLAGRQGEYASIKTVIIDSGTECQTLSLEAIVTSAIAKNKIKYKDRSPDEVYMDDYGKSTAQLKRIFRWFRDLPMNVFITALPQMVFPKGENLNSKNLEPLEVRPQFTAKLGEAVMGYMDMVWYMYKDNNGRHLLTQDTGKFRAKTRGMKFSQVIGPVIDIRDELNPEDEGLGIPDIYDLYLEAEAPSVNNKKKK